MPKGGKAGRVRDKWKEKTWVVVEAPPSFGSTPIAYVPITHPEKAVGQVVETTLYDIVKQDPQQYTIKLYFQIAKVDDEKASSIFKGHEYSREYLRSLIRRGSTMVNHVNHYTTKDGFQVRVYVVALTQGRITASRKSAVRLIAHRILAEKTANLTYDQFAQEAVLGKVASDIYNEVKKITHLRHVGVRKTKLIRRGEVAEVAPQPEAVAEAPPPAS